MGKDYALLLDEPEYEVLLGNSSADFGQDAIADFGTPYGDYGQDLGQDLGAEPAAAPGANANNAAAALMRNPQAAHAALAQHIHRQNAMASAQGKLGLGPRTGLLRSAFILQSPIAAVGTAISGFIGGNSGFSAAPQYDVFQPETLTTNVPQPNFIFIADVKVNSGSLLTGGADDAFSYTVYAQGSAHLRNDTPLNQTTPLYVLATYAGSAIWQSATYTGAFTFTCRFEGWGRR